MIRRAFFASAVFAAACGAPARPAERAKVDARAPAAMIAPADRARWSPSALGAAEALERLPDGTARGMVGRLRVEESPDGSLRMARDLLPFTRPSAALALPARVGGGYAFASPGSPSVVHHAPSFLGPLTMIARAAASPVTLVAARDRLLVATRDRVEAIDVASGKPLATEPLPPFTRLAGAAYVEPDRALLLLDLWGLVVTNDGGKTFLPVDLPDVRGVAAEGDMLIAATPGAKFSVGPDGEPSLEGALVQAKPKLRALPPLPLGGPPLKVAVEAGWPVSDDTLVVAKKGWVASVRASDGVVLAKTRSMPEEEDSTCLAIRFGVDVGFVCGGEGRGTRIHELVPPASSRVALSFTSARMVSPSGNGGVVIHGGCDEGAAKVDLACIVAPDGTKRDVRIAGDAGVTRVVALSDGTAAVLVPPRSGDDGTLALVARDGKVTRVPLALPDDRPVLRRGLWLSGMQEIGEGELSGWVEGGGSMTGVRVSRTGDVRAGVTRTEPFVSASGPVALAVAPRLGRVFETRDAGLTWDAVELPDAGQGSLGGPGLRCSQAGCVVAFESPWLRVGWGPPRDPGELVAPEDRALPSRPSVARRPRSLSCELVSVDEPPKPTDAKRETQPDFFGVAAPAVPAGSLSLSEQVVGQGNARLYAWMPRGATTPGARYVVRYFDRFAQTRGVRSTQITRAPFADDTALQEALGREGAGLVVHALTDAGGAGVLLSACRSNRDGCDLYGAADGRSLTKLPVSEELSLGRVIPPSASATLLDDGWFLAQGLANEVVVLRLDPSGAKVLARFPRHGTAPLVRLVRRARSRGLGLLVRGQGTFDKSDEDFLVFPVDPDTGAKLTPVRLSPSDLSGQPPPLCSPDEDGWVLDVPFGYGPSMQGAQVGDVELRVRLDGTRACTDAMSGRLRGTTQAAKRPPLAKLTGWPLVATSNNGARIVASCR